MRGRSSGATSQPASMAERIVPSAADEADEAGEGKREEDESAAEPPALLTIVWDDNECILGYTLECMSFAFPQLAPPRRAAGEPEDPAGFRLVARVHQGAPHPYPMDRVALLADRDQDQHD